MRMTPSRRRRAMRPLLWICTEKNLVLLTILNITALFYLSTQHVYPESSSVPLHKKTRRRNRHGVSIGDLKNMTKIERERYFEERKRNVLLQKGVIVNELDGNTTTTSDLQRQQNVDNSTISRRPHTNLVESMSALQKDRQKAQLSYVLSRKECLERYNTFDFPYHGCLVKEGRPHCQFQDLQIDVSKIHSTTRGGEPLDDVLGQPEAAEYLKYEQGAFSTTKPIQDPQRASSFQYMNEILNALDHRNTTTCLDVWENTTLFLTRYEYANFYHAMMDWWNAFLSSPKNEPVNLVFLDSHPVSNLDSVWQRLFQGKVMHLQHLPANQTCFEKARFVPSGYTSPLFPHSRPKCPDPSQMESFVKFVLETYNLTNVHRVPGCVVVIDRIPYMAHARSGSNYTERRLSNLRELALRLPSTSLSNYTTTRLQVKIVTLVDQDMAQQIASIRQADILLANHGAGLAHMIWLESHAHVIEMGCSHGHFPELASWKPNITHHCFPKVENNYIDKNYWDGFVVSTIKKALQEE